jgi:hypothetical protein
MVMLPPVESLALMMLDSRRRVSMRYDKVAETCLSGVRYRASGISV